MITTFIFSKTHIFNLQTLAIYICKNLIGIYTFMHTRTHAHTHTRTHAKMNTVTIHRLFQKWKRIVDERRYDEWCETHLEELEEAEFARTHSLGDDPTDTVYWCWNCKYGCCDKH